MQYDNLVPGNEANEVRCKQAYYELIMIYYSYFKTDNLLLVDLFLKDNN